jgi:hypothetical protein
MQDKVKKEYRTSACKVIMASLKLKARYAKYPPTLLFASKGISSLSTKEKR